MDYEHVLQYEPEVWVPLVSRDKNGVEVKGLSEKYSISSYGRVYNNIEEIFVSPVLTGKPQYFYVNIQPVGGKRLLRRVHNLMAHSFYGCPEKGETCDHEDINRFNNSLWNLRWLDRKGQMRNRGNSLKLSCGTHILDKIEGSFNEDTIKHYNRMVYHIKEKEHSWEDLKNKSSLGGLFGNKGLKTVNVGDNTYYLGHLVQLFELNIDSTYDLIQNGLTFQEILLGYTLKKPRISEYIVGYSIEFDGMWFPNKTTIKQHYSIGDYKLSNLLKYSSWKSYMIMDGYSLSPEYIKELKGSLRNKERWDYLLSGTKSFLSGKYDKDLSYVETMLNQGWGLYKILTEPESKVEHHYLNRKWYSYQDLSDISGVCPILIRGRVDKGFSIQQAITPYRRKSADVRKQSGNHIFMIDGEYWWWDDVSDLCGIEQSLKEFLKMCNCYTHLVEILNLKGKVLNKVETVEIRTFINTVYENLPQSLL